MQWSKNCVNSESRTAEVGEDNPVAAPSITGATFQLNSIKLHVLVLILHINDNITFLEKLKQGFKTTVSWNKYRSEKKSIKKIII